MVFDELVTFVVAFIAIVFAREQSLQLSPIIQMMVGLIAAVYLVADGYCGKLCWRTDKALEDFDKNPLSVSAEAREGIRKYLRDARLYNANTAVTGRSDRNTVR
jgi:hypothetical protein